MKLKINITTGLVALISSPVSSRSLVSPRPFKLLTPQHVLCCKCLHVNITPGVQINSSDLSQGLIDTGQYFLFLIPQNCYTVIGIVPVLSGD